MLIIDTLVKFAERLNNKAGFYLLYKIYLRLQGVRSGRHLFFRNRPIVRNNGTMVLGDTVTMHSLPDGEFCRTRVITNFKNSKITIGGNSILRGSTVWASEEISIGKNFVSAPYAWIVDHDAHGILPEQRSTRYSKSAPIKIGDNVWLGYRVLVLKGATIGDNCVIAAGAIVTGDIPANSVAAGVPARVVKKVA